MTPEAFERVAERFGEAAAAGPATRRLILDGIADAAERAQVESLLAHDSPQSLPAPAVPSPGVRADRPDRIVGRTIAHYRVLRLIASGGMGRVYEAEQASPRRRVALKVLRAGPASRDALRRFQDEAAALARVSHPGIAQVLEAGEFDDEGAPTPFLAMELVSAAATITAHARGLPSLRERVMLLAAVCDAVHHAHLRGVIHRDLKPDNILVDDAGRARVIDFGVARLTGPQEGATVRTEAGQIVGTLQYMSPEQREGDVRDLDARTDIYSLGAILYELVCGRPAHDLSGLSIAAALTRLRNPPALVRAVAPRVGRDLESVILKAMAPSREDRYESAADLGADLRRFLAGAPTAARPAGAWVRLSRWIGRHPVVATGTACLLVAALSLGATFAAIHDLALRPDRLETAPGWTGVWLESRAGHRLATWDAAPDGRIVYRAMMPRPASLGGGRLVVLAFDHRALASGLAGEVCAFDAATPARAVWTSGSWPLRPPPAFGDRPQASASIDFAIAADVIAAAPGLEVVVIHSMFPYSASAIRVYDLTGRLRYETWHDGAIGRVEWLSGPGLLVLSGVNSERRWDERGQRLPELRYPPVVFAVEPRDGHHATAQWAAWGGERFDETLRWYRWLGPCEHLGSLPDAYVTLNPAEGAWDPSRFVSLAVSARGPAWQQGRAGFTLVLDERGDVQARWEDDGHRSRVDAGEALPGSAYNLYDYERLPPPAP